MSSAFIEINIFKFIFFQKNIRIKPLINQTTKFEIKQSQRGFSVRKFRLKILLCLVLSAVICGGVLIYTASRIPDNYYVVKGEDVKLDTVYPVTTTVTDVKDDRYSLDVKFLGVIPVKKVNVRVVEDTSVIVGGEAFGVKFYTDGVIVVGMSDVTGEQRTVNPAFEAGIRVGDVIKSVNGEKITSNEDLSEIVEKSNGKALKIDVVRQSLEYSVNVIAEKEKSSGQYKLGLWVRDSAAGIGTITYFDPVNKTFAGLGHSICDADTGEIMPLAAADVVGVDITSVKKSEKGVPGEIRGTFNDSFFIGSLYSNVEEGVYGNLTENFNFGGDEPVEIVFKQDVYEGSAKIRCCVDGTTVREYDIVIENVNRSSTQKTKNMIIKVTDTQLLEITGGIVQGMSGSPILQDGKLVGAVTHVLINSPTEGYGIFIENMLVN